MFTYLRVYLFTYVRIFLCNGKISISFWKVLIVWFIWCLFRSIIKILWKLLVSSELKFHSCMCLFINFVKLLIGEWLDVNYLYTKFSKWLSKWIISVRKETVEKYCCKGGVELKGFCEERYKWSIVFGGIMGCLNLAFVQFWILLWIL